MTQDLVIGFDEEDIAREAKEDILRGLDDGALSQLLAQTRRQAAQARAADDMERLFYFVRGMKTIHRIAQSRGLVLRRPRSVEGP